MLMKFTSKQKQDEETENWLSQYFPTRRGWIQYCDNQREEMRWSDNLIWLPELWLYKLYKALAQSVKLWPVPAKYFSLLASHGTCLFLLLLRMAVPVPNTFIFCRSKCDWNVQAAYRWWVSVGGNLTMLHHVSMCDNMIMMMRMSMMIIMVGITWRQWW